MKYVDGVELEGVMGGNILILKFENWEKGGVDLIDQPFDLCLPWYT